MKRMLFSLLAVAMLAGCGTGLVPGLSTSQGENPATAQAAKVVGTVGSIELKGQPVLVMQLDGKRLLGKNAQVRSPFYKIFDAQTRRWDSSSGSPLYLAKNGGLYIAAAGDNTKLWRRVGTYQASSIQLGQPVSYKLDGENTFRLDGEFIHLDVYHDFRTGRPWNSAHPQLVEAK